MSPPQKQPRRDWSTETDEGTTNVEVSVLESINNKLSILEILHADIKELKTSLEFTQSQIEVLQVENKELKLTVNTLTAQVNTISNDNKTMKETILDLQSRSMRDNLIFTGITEQPQDNPEIAIKVFMQSALKLSQDTVNNITFHRVRCQKQHQTETRCRQI